LFQALYWFSVVIRVKIAFLLLAIALNKFQRLSRVKCGTIISRISSTLVRNYHFSISCIMNFLTLLHRWPLFDSMKIISGTHVGLSRSGSNPSLIYDNYNFFLNLKNLRKSQKVKFLFWKKQWITSKNYFLRIKMIWF
jgi:hypothetical protein